MTLYIAATFIIILGVAALTATIPSPVFFLYLIASLTTFTVYAVDKKAAQRARRRTPERTLHTLALVGGWPGAMIAQSLLRHKSKKQPFRRIFWTTVIINGGALAWLFTAGALEF